MDLSRAYDRAVDGATFAVDVLAWTAGVLLVVIAVALALVCLAALAGTVHHRWHVTSTSRRLRRQVG